MKNTLPRLNKLIKIILLSLTSVTVSSTPSLDFESSNGDFKTHLGGRFQVDAAKYFDDGPVSLGSGIEVRRARLFISGTYLGDWQFKAQYDFTALEPQNDTLSGLKDAYIAYSGFKSIDIMAGHFKEPFGLDEHTSSNYSAFIERSLAASFAPGRNIGLALSGYNDHWTASAGIYNGGLSQPVHGGYGITGRITYSPVHTQDHVIHFGLAASRRETNDDNTLRFRQRPESHITEIHLVDTGKFDAESFYLLGLEAAYINGPFSIQSEYRRVETNNKTAGNPELTASGFYVESSWFITGESRHYSFKDGSFKQTNVRRVINQGGFGAWEIAVRYSSIDLTEETIIGGEEDNVTIGLNWYPNNQLRLMANYTKVISTDRPGNLLDNVEPDIFHMRAQVYW
ncbi:MAG: porin [Proteobacteria bacterium]|nr:porin [Pseudomonadota bacterium]